METLIAAMPWTVEDVFDMSVEELRTAVDSLGLETKGVSKLQLQKLLAKSLSTEEGKVEARHSELRVQQEAEEAERQVKREEAEWLHMKEESERNFELAKLRLQMEIDADARKVQMEIEARKEEREAEDRKFRIEAEIMERRARLSAEERKFQLELEDKERQRQHELQLRTLESNVVGKGDVNEGDRFRIASAVKLLPKFDEIDIEYYLLSFEKTMAIHKFPKDKWTALMHTQLTGKAQKVFAELSVEECQNYDILKQALLTAYARVPEFYRKRFRSMVKGNLETYSNFAFRLSFPFKSWLQGEEAFQSLERTLEVLKLEQFVTCLPIELHRWVIEKKPKTLAEAAKWADEYAILYNPFRVDSLGGTQNETKEEFGATKQNWNQKFQSSSSKLAKKPAFPKAFNHPVVCGYCGMRNHTISNCFAMRERQAFPTIENSQDGPAHVELVQSMCTTQNSPSLNAKVHVQYLPFCSSGTVKGCDGALRPVVMLRDSGALQSLASSALMHPSEFKDTHEDRLIQGVVGEPVQIPLVELQVQGDLINGSILCGLVDRLPPGIDILIGNDLAPVDISAVTRLQAAKINDQWDGPPSIESDHTPGVLTNVPADLEDCFLSELFAEGNEVQSTVGDFVSKEELVKLQRVDESLKPLFDLVSAGHDTHERNLYEIRDEVLVRRWRNRNTPEGAELTQVIVPVPLRNQLLKVSHDIPASGHLGTQKTLDRLLRHFCWPGIHKSVKEYCRTCDICQRLGKGAQKIRAPLINLPVISKPFSRLAIDIVGPLSTCDKSRNRFILTVMDLATHYPLAFPLRTHTALEVAKALISVFTMFGFPDEILSDCGSEFMSEIIQLFLHECQVCQLKTSPFHPQANGCLERFHRTLKDMLKAIGEEFPGSWDEILPWILFAYREVPVQGLGFSAFDLTFGRDVKGPLQLIKQNWLRCDILPDMSKSNLIDFVLDLRERIRHSVHMVNDNELIAKAKSKAWYDKHARNVMFQEGDKVLLLLPLIGKPLQAKYCGPYVVLRRLGEVDYLISTPDRRKAQRVVHVNLMKRYVTREVDCSEPDTVNVVCPVVHDTQVKLSLLNDVVTEHLDETQARELKSLLSDFESVFSDRPGTTTLITHQIELQPGARPVHQSPYRLHPEKLKAVNAEISQLLKDGIIEESESPWAAPIVVVPKPDGSNRLCTDFRKLNAVTIPDPFPMPRIDMLIDKVGGAKFLTKLDMTKGYWQIPLAPSAIPLTGFVTSHGHFQWKYMSFGLRNAPSTFSRLVKKLFAGLDPFCDAYLDDVIIFSENWVDHLDHLRQVLSRIEKARLTLNVKKCVFANAEIDFLGHHLGLNQIRPRSQKVEVLLAFPQPKNKKQVQSLLGLAGYYRRYLPHFADLTYPLTEMLKKDRRFAWSAEAQRAFVDLKSRLASRPILRPPDYSLPFVVAVDASQFCVGGCLLQVIDGLEHPVCFLSRKLKVHELHYSTVEKEALALVLAVRAFSVYFGSSPVIVYTDHSPLQFINSMANSNQKLLRWSLELQQFCLDIRHRPGRLNLLPDILSRPAIE